MSDGTVSGVTSKLFAGMLIVAVACSALATPAAGQGSDERRTLALKISTPDGDFYVNLLGETDGLVRIPVASEVAEAIQVSTKLAENDQLRVVFHSVIDEFTIEPMAQYDLPLPEGSDVVARHWFMRLPMDEGTIPLKGQPVEELEFHELSTLDLEGWKLAVTFFPSLDKNNCACCGCESLYCCPNPGRCMACGDCGDCCCAGPP